MARFNKPCLTCGRLQRNGSYCEEHQPVRQESARRKAIKRDRYDATYRKLAKHVRDNTEVCHICGEGWRPNDPWEADHIDPTNPDAKYWLAGAHRSCNQKKGNRKIIPGEGTGRRLPEMPRPVPPMSDIETNTTNNSASNTE